MSNLRAQAPDDLPFLTGGGSPFDDFGSRAAPTVPAPATLDASGALTVVADDGDVAGDVSWHWRQWGPNEGSRCVMIGIWLRPGHRGQGLGTRAHVQLTDLLFRHTTTNRVEAGTDIENLAEQRALEKAGFTREGIIRGCQWRDGAYHHDVLYAILRGDPRPVAEVDSSSSTHPVRTAGG